MNKTLLNIPATGLRVALYIRLSPKPEGAVGDNYSIDSQIHEGREKALRDYGCADPVIFTDKTSGKDLNRPGMDRLRDDIRKRKFDVVIARHLDRWTRDSFDIQLTMRELIKANCKLEFVSGPGMEDTPAGEFSFTVLAAAGQLERRMLADRSRRCRSQKARDGFAHACEAPYGYRYKGHKDGCRGEYEILESEAKIVRRIFEEMASGKSRYQITKGLNSDGVPTRHKGNKQRGRAVAGSGKCHGFWFPNSVTNILVKTAYYGERIEMGETITVPKIVSKELWDAAHAQKAENAVAKVGRPSQNYLLTGKVWCAKCSRRLIAHRGNDEMRQYYRCRHLDPATGERICLAKGGRKEKMDEVTWTALWETLTQPKLLTRVIAEYHAAVSNRGDDKDVKRIEKLRRAVAHYDRIFRDPESPVDYDTRKADLANARRELLHAESSHTAAPVFQMPTAKAVEALCRQFAECANLKEFAHRRGIIERAVDRIFFADNMLHIHAFVDVLPLLNRKQHEHGVSNLAVRIPFVIERRVA